MVDSQIEYSALLRNPSEVEPPWRTEEATLYLCISFSVSTIATSTYQGSVGG